jgi:DNA topoisomerase-1
VRDPRTLRRIQSLVLPPAWRDVRIAADPRAHLQATGRDAAGRKQYRYHPLWTKTREATKYHRTIAFGDALPAIRRQVRRDAHEPPLSQRHVMATVVQLLERTHLRVGNEEYVRANGSHGLTTLRDRHVAVRGPHVRFAFRAKSGVEQTVTFTDAQLARAVRRCQDLPGQTLFQYRDEVGRVRALTSADVNAYVRAIGGEAFTAKDFRTWAGTLAAAQALDQRGPSATPTACNRTIVSAIDAVARALGNTRAVCRRCYVHPAVLEAYAAGVTLRQVVASPKPVRGLAPAEVRLLALLRRAERAARRDAA